MIMTVITTRIMRDRTTIRAMAYGGGEESELFVCCLSDTLTVGDESTKKDYHIMSSFNHPKQLNQNTNKWSYY